MPILFWRICSCQILYYYELWPLYGNHQSWGKQIRNNTPKTYVQCWKLFDWWNVLVIFLPGYIVGIFACVTRDFHECFLFTKMIFQCDFDQIMWKCIYLFIYLFIKFIYLFYFFWGGAIDSGMRNSAPMHNTAVPS